MVLGFTGFAIEILQIGPLIMTWIKTKYFNLTPRDKFTMEQPPAFNPMAAYASTLVSLLLASTYSLIAPLMAPFAFVLFGLQYLIMKYLVFYVYRTDIENNGKWWPRLFKLSIYCIVISQLMAFGSMLLMFSTRSNSSNGYIASFLVLPLAFISWAFYHWMIQTRLRDANDPQFAVTPERRLELEVSLFNPCMGQPLEKVWVSASSGKVLAQDYAPEFISTKDFMEKKGTDSEVHHSRMAKRLVNYSESKTKDWEGCKSSEGIPPEWVQALDDVAGHETLPTSSTGTPVNEAV